MLPSSFPEEAAHSQAVERLVRDRIAQRGGWISFEEFMDLALYAPGLGYYSAGSAKLGPAGDFITAPEISDLFSICVAHQCADILALTGGDILELGAGTGRMAAALLEALAALNRLPGRYLILEVSADLRDRQRATLERLPQNVRDRVTWLDRLPDKPIRGAVLANEVLDALPCHRIIVRDGSARTLGVSLDGAGAFVEQEGSTAPEQESTYRDLLSSLREPLPDGYRSEICLRLAPWTASIADCLETGVWLAFDYGLPRAHYYHPQRSDGTLRCHFKQRAHNDPFINIGIQDITAWVDFTRFAESAQSAGLDVLGFSTQAAFLLAMDIERLVGAASNTVERARLAGEARRLLMPGEMGEAFKVMAVGRNFNEWLRGFSLQDLRDSL
jgi:SAM-dependent MidA family methyltransferase